MVLSIYNTPEKDRIRTVSQRTKPNSRTILIGEQPNPWNLLQLQDMMSRHRGAKRLRRYELLGVISLLSLVIVGERVSSLTSTSEPYVRVSPHTAPR